MATLTVTWASSATDLAKAAWLPSGTTTWTKVLPESLCYPGGRMVVFGEADGTQTGIAMEHILQVVLRRDEDMDRLP